ncbi:MAG: hypothetical protein AAF642_07390 [Pseudomonadota bacterium]
MYRFFGAILLFIALAGFASATPENATSTATSSAAATDSLSYSTATYSSYHKKHKYSYSHKYGGHGYYHKRYKVKVIYRTCKKWKRHKWWWGWKKGKKVKYVCKPHDPASP